MHIYTETLFTTYEPSEVRYFWNDWHSINAKAKLSCDNFVNCAPILVIFSLLWSGMICTQTYKKIFHCTLPVLSLYLRNLVIWEYCRMWLTSQNKVTIHLRFDGKCTNHSDNRKRMMKFASYFTSYSKKRQLKPLKVGIFKFGIIRLS